MVLALVPMLSSYQTAGVERTKGEGDFPLVNISAFALQRGGDIQSFNEAQAPGTTIVFKVDLSRPYAIALAMAKGGGRPEVRYRSAAVQAGIGQISSLFTSPAAGRISTAVKIAANKKQAESLMFSPQQVLSTLHKWKSAIEPSCARLSSI